MQRIAFPHSAGHATSPAQAAHRAFRTDAYAGVAATVCHRRPKHGGNGLLVVDAHRHPHAVVAAGHRHARRVRGVRGVAHQPALAGARMGDSVPCRCRHAGARLPAVLHRWREQSLCDLAAGTHRAECSGVVGTRSASRGNPGRRRLFRALELVYPATGTRIHARRPRLFVACGWHGR